MAGSGKWIFAKAALAKMVVVGDQKRRQIQRKPNRGQAKCVDVLLTNENRSGVKYNQSGLIRSQGSTSQGNK
jgi:hypothetical protein